MTDINSVINIGPKSTKRLNEAGFYTIEDLEKLGVIEAYMHTLSVHKDMKPNLNFLYAMVGAVENIHWQEVASTQKAKLLIELEKYKEMERFLNNKPGS